jgi:hypothetical protein
MSNKEWGNITWSLFHNLAARVKEDKFSEVKDKLINIVISTCNNLPCPICMEHASNHILKRAYIGNIKTKEHFIEFLRQMHNIVNIKLHKKNYTIEEIKDMYLNENLGSIINNFFRIYSIQYHNMRLMANSMNRKIFLKKFANNLNEIKYAIE